MRSYKYIDDKTILMPFLLLLGILFLVGCTNQSAPEMKRVGILGGLPGMEFMADSLKAEMTELGYVEGENIEYDVQIVGFDMAVYQEVLQKFIDEEVDVIYVFPSEATIEAKAATEGTDIPVVFSIALVDGLGVINSVREPGGNITGVQYPPGIAVNRYDVMRQLVPDAKRLLIPHQRGYPIVAPQLDAIRPAAEADGVTLIEMPLDNVAELEAELQKLAEDGDVGVDAILLLAEPFFVAPDSFPILSAFAEEHQLPIGGNVFFAEGYNSMFGVDIDFATIPTDVAPLIDKILQGVPAGTIPVVSSESYFTLHKVQLDNMGIEIPEELLIMADVVLRPEDLVLPEGEIPEGGVPEGEVPAAETPESGGE